LPIMAASGCAYPSSSGSKDEPISVRIPAVRPFFSFQGNFSFARRVNPVSTTTISAAGQHTLVSPHRYPRLNKSLMQRMLAGQIPALRRYARALTGELQAADDLVQESLERAWRKSGHWKPELPLRPWLFTLMHNVHVNGLRRQRPVVLSEPPTDIVDPVRSGPQRAMDLRDLETGLAQLPDAQREVLLLVCLEEMRYEEVAQVLDIPVGTVMSRLHRARKALRSIMHQDQPADPATRRTNDGPTIRRVK